MRGTYIKNGAINKLNILKFREQIIDHLLINNHHNKEMAIGNQIPTKRGSHFLHSYEEPVRKTRQRCKECCKCLCKRKGREYATKKTKKVTTYCNNCKGQPALCLQCFEKLHRNK